MTVDELINKSIKYAEGRIEFWKNSPQERQVWIGIKAELTLLLKDMKRNTND